MGEVRPWGIVAQTFFNTRFSPSLHMLSRFSHVQLFMTPWTIAHQAPLPMGFSRQEYWSGLPWPPPGCHLYMDGLVAQRLKCLPAMRETRVRSLGREDPLEKEMATHSNILAWRIPWMEEPGGLQFMGSQRVGHNWVTSLSLSPRCPL